MVVALLVKLMVVALLVKLMVVALLVKLMVVALAPSNLTYRGAGGAVVATATPPL